MAEQPFTKDTVYDAITAFDGGINSGLNPLLLERNQLAFAQNATVRGGFITHRPPYRKMTLSFGDDAALQEAFETGYFQGGCTYRPDFGNHSLVASVSGRFYQLQISGQTATVSDVTPANDPNPPLTTQTWMFQAEKWVIGNNGLNLPVIFDGQSSRRSYGPSVLLATGVAFAPANPPDINETVTVTLSAPYTGPLNVPVNFNGAIYEIKSTASGYPATLRPAALNLSGSLVFPEGTELNSRPDLLGYVAAISTSNGNLTSVEYWSTGSVAVGEVVRIDTTQFTIATLSIIQTQSYPEGVARRIRITPVGTVPLAASPGVNFILRVGATSPTTTVGSLQADETISLNPGDSTSVDLIGPLEPYTNLVVWAQHSSGLIFPFFVSGSGQTAANVVTLINLNDTSSDAYVNPSPITSVAEFGPCRMGAYGMGRIWMSLTDGISFLAGNIVGGEAGTPGQLYRDAILKVTENDYLNGGGTFRLPNSGDVITAMLFTANLDASLGQGPLQVFTSRSVFSCNAPVDRTTWQDLTFPILSQSLLGSGALAQQSTFQVNSDTLFRAIDGWRSLILARRDFSDQWGNTPITREMERVLIQEDKNLIPFVSGAQFDNRALFGAVPQATANGICTVAAVALNLDPVSSLRAKAPPVFDGSWGNLNVLQYFRAVVDSVDRCFALVHNSDTLKIELWELLAGDAVGTSVTDPTIRQIADNDGETEIPIEWSLETASLFKEVKMRPLLRLINGEIWVDDVMGDVEFHVQYRPDQYPCWTTWHRWTVCVNRASTPEPELKPAFYPKMGLGEPAAQDCDQFTNRPMREGHTFQFRIAIKGHCRFLGARFAAVPAPDPQFHKPICNLT